MYFGPQYFFPSLNLYSRSKYDLLQENSVSQTTCSFSFKKTMFMKDTSHKQIRYFK